MRYCNIAFLGLGRMGEALIREFVNGDKKLEKYITATHHDKNSLNKLNDLNVKATTSNIQAIQESKIIVICVRPQQVLSLIHEIKSYLNKDHVLISLAIGVPIDWLRRECKGIKSIFHVHPPSTIMALFHGISFIAAEKDVVEEDLKLVSDLFSLVGKIDFISENEIDMYAVFAGCSPAFYLKFLKEWEKSAIEGGIEKTKAREIIKIMFASLNNGVVNNGFDYDYIIDKIATPKGVTSAGLSQLTDNMLFGIYKKVIEASKNKIYNIRSKFKHSNANSN